MIASSPVRNSLRKRSFVCLYECTTEAKLGVNKTTVWNTDKDFRVLFPCIRYEWFEMILEFMSYSTLIMICGISCFYLLYFISLDYYWINNKLTYAITYWLCNQYLLLLLLFLQGFLQLGKRIHRNISMYLVNNFHV